VAVGDTHGECGYHRHWRNVHGCSDLLIVFAGLPASHKSSIRVNLFLGPYARARGADRAAAAASTAIADSVLANSGSGRTLEPPLVRLAAMVTAPR
jgi:hypothetical protein